MPLGIIYRIKCGEAGSCVRLAKTVIIVVTGVLDCHQVQAHHMLGTIPAQDTTDFITLPRALSCYPIRLPFFITPWGHTLMGSGDLFK
jgi:hypothetical protein